MDIEVETRPAPSCPLEGTIFADIADLCRRPPKDPEWCRRAALTIRETCHAALALLEGRHDADAERARSALHVLLGATLHLPAEINDRMLMILNLGRLARTLPVEGVSSLHRQAA